MLKSSKLEAFRLLKSSDLEDFRALKFFFDQFYFNPKFFLMNFFSGSNNFLTQKFLDPKKNFYPTSVQVLHQHKITKKKGESPLLFLNQFIRVKIRMMIIRTRSFVGWSNVKGGDLMKTVIP